MGRNKNQNTPRDFSEREVDSIRSVPLPPQVEKALDTGVDTTQPLSEESSRLIDQITTGDVEWSPEEIKILEKEISKTNGTPKKSRRKELPIAVQILDPTNVGLALWRARLLFDLLIGELALMLTDIPTSARLKRAAQDEKEQLISTIQKWKPIKTIQGVLDRIPVPPEADINPKTGLDQEEDDE